MSERLKIEDMTLGQIKGLKKEISDEIRSYLKKVVGLVNKKFDLGEIDVSVRTDVYDLEFESCSNPIKSVDFIVLQSNLVKNRYD